MPISPTRGRTCDLSAAIFYRPSHFHRPRESWWLAFTPDSSPSILTNRDQPPFRDNFLKEVGINIYIYIFFSGGMAGPGIERINYAAPAKVLRLKCFLPPYPSFFLPSYYFSRSTRFPLLPRWNLLQNSRWNIICDLVFSFSLEGFDFRKERSSLRYLPIFFPITIENWFLFFFVGK